MEGVLLAFSCDPDPGQRHDDIWTYCQIPLCDQEITSKALPEYMNYGLARTLSMLLGETGAMAGWYYSTYLLATML